MIILIYIASLKHICCQIFKEMDKIKIMGFHQPLLFDDPPYPNDTPISPHIHQKMRKGCRNDCIEALQFIKPKKKLFKKKILVGLQQPPLQRTRVNTLSFFNSINNLQE